MENYQPNPVNPKDNFRKDWNKLLDFQRRQQLQSSSDILVSQTTHGTTLVISDKIKKKIGGGGISNAGTFSEAKSYAVDDLIFVDFNGSYSVPFSVPSGSAFPALVAGVFLCVKDVPASGSRSPYNYYYPICPTIPTGSAGTVSGSLVNQTYWEPINPLLSMSVCLGGQATAAYWVGAFPATPFDLTQLPYTGSLG